MRNDPAGIDAALASGATLLADHLCPLHLAAEFNAPLATRHLLSLGCTMQAELPRNERGTFEHHRTTALHSAAFLNEPEIVRLLLKADPQACLNGPDAVFTATPLALAAMVGAEDIIKDLLAAGADVNARDSDHAASTPLDYAVERGRPGIVRMLLAAGADPDIPTWMWMSARDHALRLIRPSEIYDAIAAVPFTSHRLPDGRWTQPPP